MSTATLTPEARRNVALFAAGELTTKEPKYTYEERDGAEALIITGLPVFRSGTFRDSMGFQHTWESLHMDQMVSHFDLLRNRSIFADVPVRSGHPGFLSSGQEGNGKVVGYHTRLYTETRVSKADSKEYTFLLTDLEILDQDAVQAIRSGLWRNRSAEVGSYITNDEAEFWPVYMGVAFVDIPAVEGLNSFSKQSNFSLMMETESTVPEKEKEGQAAPEAPKVPQPPAPPAPPASQVVDHSQAKEPEKKNEQAQHSAPHAFTVAGQKVFDFAAVQAHIDALEAFQDETIAARREDFVKGLVASGKILGPQEEATAKFAASLTPEQFESWKETWEAVPSNSLLGNYGQSDQAGQSAPSSEESDLEVARSIVEMHKHSGMAHDRIKQTASYKSLIVADPTFTL